MPEYAYAGALPATGFIRESQLVNRPVRKAKGDKPERPAVCGIIPFSGPTLWRMCRAGTFPRPVKLSDRVTAWRCEDVHAWIAARGAR